MNNALLAGALLLMVGLFALLLAPFFIDWNSYKSQLETYASAYLGADVRVEDELELSFLPRPSLKARNVSIRSFGGDAGGVEMEEMSLRVNLPQLLQRKIVIESMVLQGPRLTMVRTQDGAFQLPSFLSGLFGEDGAQGQLAAANVMIENGRLIYRDEKRGAEASLDELNLSLSLDGPQGPLRIEGGGRHEGELYTGRFSAVEDGGPGLRVFFQAEAAGEPFLATAEGRLAEPVGGGLTFEGTFSAAANEEGARLYALKGEASADLDGAVFSGLELEAGAEGRGFDVAGEGALRFAPEPKLTLDLQSDQLVLAAANGAQEQDPGFTAVRNLLRSISVPLELDLSAQSLLVDGALFENLDLGLSTQGDIWQVGRFSLAQGRGTRFSADGELNTAHDAFVFRGKVDLQAPSPASLRPLMEHMPDQLARAMRGLRQPVSLAAEVSASADVLRVNGMSAALGDTRIEGDIWFSQLGAKPVLERTKLSFNALDLAAFEGPQNFFSSLSETLSPDNGRIEITARDSRLGELPLGDLSLALARENDVFSLGYLNLTDAKGGKLDASGEVFMEDGALFASLSGRVRSDRLDLITALLRPMIPSALSRRLARLASYSEGSDLTLDTSFSLAEGAMRDLVLDVEGVLGGTEVSASGNMVFSGESSEPPRLEIALRNENGNVLLAQLGSDDGETAPAESAGFTLEISGEPQEGAEMAVAFDAGDTRFTGEGQWNGAQGTGPLFNLAISHEGPLEPYLSFIGARAGLAPGNASLAGTLSYGSGTLRFADLRGSAGDVSVAGDLVLKPGATPQLGGTLSLDSLPAGEALSWVLGQDVFRQEGLGQAEMPLFTDQPLALDRFAGVDIDLELEVDGITAGARLLASNLSGRLRLDGQRASLTDLQADTLGGRLESTVSLAAPPGGNMLLSGRLAISDASVADIVWQDAGRPLATGRVNLSLEFEGSGRTPLMLASGLAGEGALTLSNAAIRRVNPGAFRSIVQASRSGVELDETRVREVFSGYLDTGSLDLGNLEMPVRIVSGVLRLDNVALERGEERLRLNSALNIANGKVQAEWTIRSEGALVAGGTAPEATLVFSGPVTGPSRQVDVSALTGYLAVQALEREVDRIERLQADVLEKERFSRELRSLDDRRRRMEAEAAAEAEAEPEATPALTPPEDAPSPGEAMSADEPPRDGADEAAPDTGEQAIMEVETEQGEPGNAEADDLPAGSEIGFPPGFADSLAPPQVAPQQTAPNQAAPGQAAASEQPFASTSGQLLEPLPLPQPAPQTAPQATPQAPAPPVSQPQTEPAPAPRPLSDNPAWVRPDINGTLR